MGRCVVSPDGKYIVSGGGDSTVVLFDTRAQEPIEVYHNLNRGIFAA